MPSVVLKRDSAHLRCFTVALGVAALESPAFKGFLVCCGTEDVLGSLGQRENPWPQCQRNHWVSAPADGCDECIWLRNFGKCILTLAEFAHQAYLWQLSIKPRLMVLTQKLFFFFVFLS